MWTTIVSGTVCGADVDVGEDIAGVPSEVVYVPLRVLVVLMTKPGFGVRVTRRVLDEFGMSVLRDHKSV